MFANCQLMGTDMAFPDVCMTPAAPSPIPVPYTDIALGPTAIPSCPTILIMGGPAHNLATTIPMTNGDNPGVLLGVASGTVMGPSRHTTGANTVLFNGMPATRLTSTTMQNSTNAMGARIAPSQTLVLILAP